MFVKIGIRMRMVYDPEARKQYMESKHQKPNETVKQNTEVKKAESTEEGTPKWVQMVKERQEALQKAKEQMELSFSDRKDEVKKEDLKKMRESLLDLSKVCKDSQPAFQKDTSIESAPSRECDSRCQFHQHLRSSFLCKSVICFSYIYS
jgi:hypothetical protein